MDVTNRVKSIKPVGIYLLSFIKWITIGLICGIIIGGISSLFCLLLEYVTDFRMEHSFIIYLLPLAGLLIVFLYRASKVTEPKGTNLVIDAIHSDEDIPIKMAPLIFISTILTHLFGGSAGREGAALQLGGSIANGIGRLMRLDEKDKKIVIMCGMSAAFAALFGTPLTAAIFSMELISVGVMYYSALVPCAVSSITACFIATLMGVKPEAFLITNIPSVTAVSCLQVILLAAIAGVVSIIFCRTICLSSKLFSRYIKNQYIRVFTGGVIIIGLVLLLNTKDYLGSGMNVISLSVNGSARPEAFLLKILFTGITLGCGFKGGEIVPSLFIGATFGCFVGGLIGLPPAFGAAIGMVALFCGVTNCPLASLLMGFELFGFTTPVLFLLGIAVSYMLSGYDSLYSSQTIMYSKTKSQFINKKTR